MLGYVVASQLLKKLEMIWNNKKQSRWRSFGRLKNKGGFWFGSFHCRGRGLATFKGLVSLDFRTHSWKSPFCVRNQGHHVYKTVDVFARKNVLRGHLKVHRCWFAHNLVRIIESTWVESLGFSGRNLLDFAQVRRWFSPLLGALWFSESSWTQRADIWGDFVPWGHRWQNWC